jgi:hypothetical protein
MEIDLLKNNIHNLIDQIQSQQLLEEYFQEMKTILQKSNSSAWDSLSDSQKKEVLLSYQESENKENLLDHNAVMYKYHDLL